MISVLADIVTYHCHCYCTIITLEFFNMLIVAIFDGIYRSLNLYCCHGYCLFTIYHDLVLPSVFRFQ